jgi:N-acetylmuramoyl-L-alanine amidase
MPHETSRPTDARPVGILGTGLPAAARHRSAGRARRRRPGAARAVTATLLGAAVGVAAAAPAAGYTVAPGDTLTGIAQEHGSTVAEIAAANGLGSGNHIVAGQELTLPEPPPPPPVLHVVAPGDTLSALGKRHGVPVAAIAEASGISADAVLLVGRQLVIPRTAGGHTRSATAADGGGDAPASSGGQHVVAAGDTLSALGARYGTTAGAIAAASEIDLDAPILVGQVLRLPVTAVEMADSFLGRTYPPEVVEAARVNKGVLLARGALPKTQVQGLIRRAAQEQGVDPRLALAIGHQESGYSSTAVSPANAVGAMQVIPTSGDWASVLVDRELDLLDPYDNATAGAAILRSHLDRYELPVAIASYYQGASSVQRDGMHPDTEDYVASVLAIMERL